MPREKDAFLEEFSKFEDADGTYVEVGWYHEQGQHPTAGMTYPELAEYHAIGKNGVIPRDVLLVFAAKYLNDPKTYQKFIDIIVETKGKGFERALTSLGKEFVAEVKSLFGSRYLHPTEFNPDPLIDTGALMEATMYKIGKG